MHGWYKAHKHLRTPDKHLDKKAQKGLDINREVVYNLVKELTNRQKESKI
jgi:hypothetical protein